MRLLDGRRVQVKDLIDDGLVNPGAALEFRRPRSGDRFLASVTPEGRIRLADGREFAAPSRAAMEAADLRAIDGWSAWTVADTGASLSSLRQTLLGRTSQESEEQQAAGPIPPSAERHKKLSSARAAAESGTPLKMTVRELLAWWGAKSRGRRIADRVSADLENYSLETRPDFRKVAVTSEVELGSQASALDEASIDEPLPAEPDRIDVGLTLGNVPSALGGITSVNPQDSLARAMTLMRLNDFSQLAVMSSPRSLKGAVTWRSIAKALAHDADATLADATEPAVTQAFDQDLVDLLAELYRHDFVLVRNAENEIAGIVTAADVVLLYGETATPYFIIGEIDHLLRSFISDEWTVEQVVAVCDPDDERRISSHDDLTFGDYQRMFEGPDRFVVMRWPLDRVAFLARLDEVRELRNSVAHFDPDPLGGDDVAALRNFLDLLRDLRSRADR